MAWGSSFDKPTDRIENYKLTDPVPLDGNKLQPRTAWKSLPSVEVAKDVFMPKPNVFSPDGYTWVVPKAIGAIDIDSPLEVVKSDKGLHIFGKHTNKVPTHDPYTNPNAIIYYECKCGRILDPGTKRFSELNNCASNAGWKIRFSDSGYVPYCVECAKGVE